MKHLSLLLLGPIVAACASHSPPPAASSATVDAATDTPSASTEPVKTDVMRAAERDRRAETAPVAATSPVDRSADSTTATAPSTTATTASTTATSSTSSVQREPARSTLADNTVATTAPAAAPDNSRVNSRDRSGETLTPGDQGTSEADRKLTQQIRQAVMKDGSLSFTAKNVKIITLNGKVTLRGPVNNEQERAAIEAAARKIAGDAQVENLLEIKK